MRQVSLLLFVPFPSCFQINNGIRSLSNAVASVLQHHCDLRDCIHAVLRVSCVVSIVDCFQSANLLKELVDHNEGGCVSA